MSGIPHVRIDGRHSVIGAGSCTGAANSYRPYIQQQLAANGGISPLQIVGSYLPTTNDVSVQVTFRLQDPASYSNLRATILIYEDNIYWCCGYGGQSDWDGTTRAIFDQNVSLVNVGDEVTISRTFVHSGAWNPDETHVVAYVQTTAGTREIYQGALLPKVLDFTFELDHLVRSVPSGNGAAIFAGLLTNIGDATDTFTLQPGAPFGAWQTQFRLAGEQNWQTGPVQITLPPAGTREVTIRVLTDMVKEIRTGGFNVTSTFSARTQATSMRVFNRSYSVLLVDDDTGNADEVKLINALNNLGYLYQHYDIYLGQGNRSPVYSNMSGFDYLIWQTGLRFSQLLSAEDMDNLMLYMDRGGALFLTSQEFLDTMGGVPNTFITNYLGVTSWTLDRQYLQMNGVAGDPIGNGITLNLQFDFASFNQGDDVVPGPTAIVSFRSPANDRAMVRNTMPSGRKSVFMPAAFNAIVLNAAPNNPTGVLDKVLEWLRPASPADAEGDEALLLASRIDGIRPNPFNPRTEIAFALSNAAAAGRVGLEVFDLEGRKVRTLIDGTLPAGSHTATWDGLASDGNAVQTGVYFARLRTAEGVVTEKMVLLK